MRTIRCHVVLALALLAVAAGCGGGKGGGTPTPPPNTNTGQGWTILVYVVADNDLEPFALLDLEEMAAAGASAERRIVAQVDRSAGYSNGAAGGLGDWTSTKRVEVSGGALREVADLGEVDMASPAALAEFVRWGLTTYPGERTALVLWDHGAGWIGFGVDETTGQGALLNLAAITQGVQQGLAGAGKTKLDVIGFDACLMATFEVAESMKAYTDVLVASEETEPGHGWDYRVLANVGAATTPAQLGTRIADGFKAQADDPQWKSGASITLSVLDLTKLGPIEAAIASLATSYPTATQVAPVLNSLGSGRSSALAFGANPDPERAMHLVDLSDLFARAGSVSGAAAIQSAVAGAVLYQVTGSATSTAHGLAIYFPPSSAYYKTTYDALPGTASWRAFLSAVYGGGASASPPGFDYATIGFNPVAANVTVSCDLTAGSAASVASAFLVYGLRDTGTGAWLLGENEAGLAASTVTGVWDWSFMRLSQGSYQEFGYLNLRTLGATQGAAVIPFVYEAGATQQDAFRLLVFDLSAGTLVSDTYYVYGAGGAVGELSPAAGSKLRAMVAYLPDAGAWESAATHDTRQWVLYDPAGAGFSATAPIGIDFVELPVGSDYFVGLRVANAGMAGDWLFTNPGTVRP